MFAQTTKSMAKDPFPYISKPDSIIKSDTYGKVYITTNTASKPYKWIVPSPNKESLDSYYADYINEIKENYNQEVSTHNLDGFPGKWNSVYVFNDKFYLYAPSDWMQNTGYYISDSIIYIAESDPADLYLILECKHDSPRLCEFHTINHSGQELNIKIAPIDPDYGIYLWAFSNKDAEIVQRKIMQDSRFAKQLPMIINDCGKNKCHSEFKFKDPDFNKLTSK